MKTIVINSPKYGPKTALVEDCDFDQLNKFTWWWKKYGEFGYAVRSVHHIGTRKHTNVYMHHDIMGRNGDLEVDHINRNTLDNQRANLRFGTHAQNGMNQAGHKDSTHGVKGVYLDKRRNNWSSRITAFGTTHHLGSFKTKQDAAIAYNNAAIKFHGPFARANAV